MPTGKKYTGFDMTDDTNTLNDANKYGNTDIPEHSSDDSKHKPGGAENKVDEVSRIKQLPIRTIQAGSQTYKG